MINNMMQLLQNVPGMQTTQATVPLPSKSPAAAHDGGVGFGFNR